MCSRNISSRGKTRIIRPLVAWLAVASIVLVSNPGDAAEQLVNGQRQDSIAETPVNSAPSFRLLVGHGQTNYSTIVGWGNNGLGQLEGIPVSSTNNIVAISAGYRHSLALWSDGTVSAWGTNDYGQTDVPPGLEGAVAISAGFRHSLALLANGTVVSWGQSNSGETNPPTDLTNAVSIAAGPLISAAVRSDGTCSFWGFNSGIATNRTNVAKLAFGAYHAVVLFQDGTVETLGANNFGQTDQPAGLTNVMTVAAGDFHSLALTSNGTVTAWGYDGYGESSVPSDLSNVVAISASAYGSLALRDDSSIAVWGTVDVNTATPALTNVMAISGGSEFALALVANLALPVIVAENSGAYSNTAADTISPGDGETSQALTFALTTADTNLFSVQPALSTNGTLTFTPAPNAYGTTTVSVILIDDGGTANGGSDTSSAQIFVLGIEATNRPPTITLPSTITVLEDVLTSLTGITLADEDDSGDEMELVLSLSFDAGELRATSGSGVTASFNPTSELTLTGTLTALNDFIAAGEVRYGPNPNDFGAGTLTVVLNDPGLGNPGGAQSATNTATLDVLPVNDPPRFTLLYQNVDDLVTTAAAWEPGGETLSPFPPTWTNLVALAAGVYHNIGLREDGAVLGRDFVNYYGAGNMPDGLTDVSAIAAGWYHSVALRHDGTVVAWGWNQWGQTNVPTGLESVRAIAAGDFHSLALRSNGTVVAWGGYVTNTAYVPGDLTNVAAIAAGSFNSDGGFDSIALLSNGVIRVWFEKDGLQTNLNLSLPEAVGLTRGFAPGTALALLNDSNAVVLSWTSGEIVIAETLTNVAQASVNQETIVLLGYDGSVEAFTAGAGSFYPAPAALTNVLSVWAALGYPAAIYRAPYQRLYSTENAGPVSVLVATNIHAGPGNEASQTVTFQVTASDPAMFSSAPAISADGILTFTAAANTHGTNLLTIITTDDGGSANGGVSASEAQTLTLVISPGPGAPIVQDDYFWLDEDYWIFQNAAAGVLANDLNLVTNSTVAELVSGVANGDLIFNADGSFFYYPEPDFDGVDTFRYRAINGADTSSVATVTLTLIPVNDPPSFDLLVGNGETNFQALAAWGRNDGGQTNVPPGLTNVAAFSAGFTHNLALLPDGTVVGWGTNDFGQIDIPTFSTNVIAVAAGRDHSLALLSDHTVVAWGGGDGGELDVPLDLTNVTAIAAGEQTSAALRDDGTLTTWGQTSWVPTNLTHVRAFDFGRMHAIALFDDGTVEAYGDNLSGQANQPTGLTNVMAIAAGGWHNVVLQSNGIVTAWGYGTYGQTNVPADLTNAISISASEFGSLAIRDDGTLAVWGVVEGPSDQPAGSPPYLAVDGGSMHALALYADTSAPITVPADAGTVSLLIVTNISTGPPAESGQHLTFTVDYSGPTLFSTIPVLDTNGVFTFVPDRYGHGTNVITVLAQDDGGTNDGGFDTSAVRSFTLIVYSVPATASPADDSYTFDEHSSLSVDASSGVLANDEGPDGDTMTAVLVTDVTNGTLSLSADGSFSYLPPYFFAGVDAFQYEVVNAAGTSAVATVTITVSPVNDPPSLFVSDLKALSGVPLALESIQGIDVDSGTNIVSLDLVSPLATFLADSTSVVTVVTNSGDPGHVTLFGAIDSLNTFVASGSLQIFVPRDITTNIGIVTTWDDHGHTGADIGWSGTATNEVSTDFSFIHIVPGIRLVSVPTNGLYRPGDHLDFIVETTEPVTLNTNGGLPYFDLNLSSGQQMVRFVSESGSTNLLFRYTVADGDYGDSLTLGQAVITNGTIIVDVDGEPLYPVLNNIASMDGIAVDGSAPQISSFTPPPDGWYPQNASITFTLSLDETVIVNTNGGIPRFEITLEATNRFANYVSGSGSGDLTFEYVVAAGDMGTNGIIIGSTLDLNGGTISDLAGNDFIPDTGPTNSLPGVRVDGVPPGFVYEVHYYDSPYYGIGSQLHFVAYSSEPVTVDTASGVPLVEYQLDSGLVYGTYVSNDFNGLLLHFLYTVQPGDSATNGVLRSTNIVFNNALIQDAAGNPANPITPGPYLLAGAVVDGFPPATTNDVILPTNAIYQAGQQLAVTLEFTEPVVFHGNPTNSAVFQVGESRQVLTNATQAQSNTLTFTYTIQAGDFDPDGVTLELSLIVEDLAGNTVTNLSAATLAGVRVDASPPIATADNFTLGEDAALAGVSVLTNDTDGDTNTLAATLIAGPIDGTLDFSADGSFTYTPAPNFFGTDSFTYTITDGVLTSAVTSVALTILATNDPPTITGPGLLVITNGVPRPLLGLGVGDADSGTNLVELILITGELGSVFHATNGNGVTVTNYQTVYTHLWGTITDLSAYLAATNLFYIADTNRVTHSEIDVLLFDHGHTGADPGLDSDPSGESASLSIAVDNGEVNAPPVIGIGFTNQVGTYGSAFSYTFETNAFLEPDGQTLHYVASGLPSGVTFTEATRTFSGIPGAPGSYTIRIIAGDGQSLELLATNSFILAVAKATLVATPDDKTRVCGAANPVFTIHYSGLIGADTADEIDSAPAGGTTATGASPPGTYAISLSGGSDDKYTFAFVDATLTITNGAGASRAGLFYGLFYETNEVRHESSGAIQLKSTDAGNYSGTLELAGRKLKLSGAFDSQRRATNVIQRAGTTPLTVELALDACQPPQALIGTVTDGSWRSEVYAAPATFHAKTNPAPMAGRYTLVLPGADGNPSLPHGDGFGVITVATSGKLKLAGALSDNSKFTDGAIVNAAGLWPLYVPQYKNQGSTIGWLLFSNGPAANPSGLISWIRPSTFGGTHYRAGFTNEFTAVGSTYIAPPKGSPLLAWTNGVGIASGGNLVEGATNSLAVGPTYKVTITGTNFGKLSLSAKDGRFKGSLNHSATGKPAAFNGVLLQNLDQGFGFFLGTNQSGRITLESLP